MKRKVTALLVLAVFIVTAGAAPAGAALKADSAPVVKAGEARGTVSDYGGNLLAGAGLRLLDGDRTALLETRTGQDGSFSLGTLVPGDYTLVVGGSVPLTFQVSADAGVDTLRLVVPAAQAPYSAGADGDGGGGFFAWVGENLVWIAGGVAIGTIIIVNNNDTGCK